MKSFLQWLETVWHQSDYKLGEDIAGLGVLNIVKHRGVRIPCARDRNNKIWYNLNLDAKCGGSVEKLAKHRKQVYWCRLVNGLGADQITANELDQYRIQQPTSYSYEEVEGALNIAARNIATEKRTWEAGKKDPEGEMDAQMGAMQNIPAAMIRREKWAVIMPNPQNN